MKRVLVISEAPNFGCAKFIMHLKKGGFTIPYLVIHTHKGDLHPLRSKQLLNRYWFGIANTKSNKIIRMFRIIISRIAAKLILQINNCKIYKIEKSFNEFNLDVDVAVLYSFEGLLCEKDLKQLGVDLINIHPAKLPEYRGLDAHLWVLKEKATQGVTAYIVDSGIDTGPVLKFFNLKPIDFKKISILVKLLKDLKSDKYLEALNIYFSKKTKRKYSKIERSQNRGVFKKRDYFDLVSAMDYDLKMEKTLLYVSPSKLSSTEANLIHVLNQCSALSKFYQNVDLMLNSDFSSNENTFFVKKKFSIEGKMLNILSTYNVTNMRLVDIAVSAFLQYAKFRHDIVISRNLYFSFAFSFFRAHVFEIHSIPDGWREWLFKAVVKNSNTKLVCISTGLQSDLCALYSINKSRIKILPDAATDFFEQKSVDNDPLELPSNAEQINIGYFGHLYEGRGIEIVVGLARNFPALSFNVFGGTDTLVKTYKKQHLRVTNLTFHGHIDYISARKCMCKQDILLLPYQEKTLLNDGQTDTARWMSPLKLFEYMASNAAILSSKLPVLEEILIDETNALLALPGDLDDWKACLERLVNNEHLRNKLASNSYQEFLNFYTWEHRAKQLIKDVL